MVHKLMRAPPGVLVGQRARRISASMMAVLLFVERMVMVVADVAVGRVISFRLTVFTDVSEIVWTTLDP
jgi:hypothetical protein